MRIFIIIGWLKFHRKNQLGMGNGYEVKLACHYTVAKWFSKYTNLYAKRLFVIY